MTKLHWHERFLKEKINLNIKLKRKDWWLAMQTAFDIKKTQALV